MYIVCVLYYKNTYRSITWRDLLCKMRSDLRLNRICIVIVIISIVIQNHYFGLWFFGVSKRNPSILTC